MSKKITTEIFINKAILVHGDRYDYSKIVYINSKTKIIIICKDHGEFEQTPNNHLRNRNCPKCCLISKSIKRSSNTKEFIEKATLVHGNKYDYSKVNYISAKEKIVIICKIHGEFLKIPDGHLRNGGCSKCSKSCKNINTKDFIEKSIQKHGNKYDYSKTIYNHCEHKLIIICKDHGEFEQSPVSHYKSEGCYICQTKGISKVQIQWLELLSKIYNIQIKHAINGGEYKIPTTRYKADGYCKKTNTIYEFHGDYWHGNPKIYKSKEFNNTCNATHGELYKKTLIKEQKIRDLGYNLVVMWESDWININKSIKTLQNKFRSK